MGAAGGRDGDGELAAAVAPDTGLGLDAAALAEEKLSGARRLCLLRAGGRAGGA